MDKLATGIVALHGCLATVVECFPLGQPDVVKGRQYTTESPRPSAFEVSLWKRKELVYASACESHRQ
jgi:hypothetical protein